MLQVASSGDFQQVQSRLLLGAGVKRTGVNARSLAPAGTLLDRALQ